MKSDCRICGTKLDSFLDLGLHPYADSFYESKYAAMSAPLSPLVCGWCENCELVQLTDSTNAQDRYNGVDYSYTSSNSNFATSHWNDFASSFLARFGRPKSVLEIGSNDGYLLSIFQKSGSEIQGVDASARMALISNEQGIPTVAGIFGEYLARNLAKKYDLVIANNVFNHSDVPLDFLTGVRLALDVKGKFVFEVPSLNAMLESLRYDQIYLEHVTYWSQESLEKILLRAGLRLESAEYVDYHGGSIRGVAVRAEDASQNFLSDPTGDKHISIEVLDEFARQVHKRKIVSLEKIHQLREKVSGDIVGIGAAAKANTTINFLELGNHLSYVTDSSLAKIGKFTPKSGLEIYSDHALAGEGVGGAIILAWNISASLFDRIRAINPRLEITTL